MSISAGAATTGMSLTILRRYLASGTCIHLPRTTYVSGKPVYLLEGRDKHRREPQTGWLVNRNVMMLLPADSDLFRTGLIRPGT
jgi:hypothetical protein